VRAFRIKNHSVARRSYQSVCPPSESRDQKRRANISGSISSVGREVVGGNEGLDEAGIRSLFASWARVWRWYNGDCITRIRSLGRSTAGKHRR
jgi:hypothetical protein